LESDECPSGLTWTFGKDNGSYPPSQEGNGTIRIGLTANQDASTSRAMKVKGVRILFDFRGEKELDAND